MSKKRTRNTSNKSERAKYAAQLRKENLTPLSLSDQAFRQNRHSLQKVVRSLLLKARVTAMSKKPKVVITMQVFNKQGYEAVVLTQREQLS